MNESLSVHLSGGVATGNAVCLYHFCAYDPAAIAVMGCGILLAAALAFPY
jgi:hypothetical protein